MPHAFPVQDRVGGITKALHGRGQIVKILKIALNRLANHIRPAASELDGSLIKRAKDSIRKPGGNLVHGKLNVK